MIHKQVSLVYSLKSLKELHENKEVIFNCPLAKICFTVCRCSILGLNAFFVVMEHGVVDYGSLISTTYIQVLPSHPVSATARMV